MEAFCWSSNYQRDLGAVAVDFFPEGFEDCRTKVLLKYSKVDMSGMSSTGTPSMPQVADSPLTDDMETITAPPKRDDVVEI